MNRKLMLLCLILFSGIKVFSQSFRNEEVLIVQLFYKKGDFKGVDFYVLNKKGNVFSAEYFENSSLKCLYEYPKEEKDKLINYINYESLSFVYSEFRKIPFIEIETKDTCLHLSYNIVQCKLTYIPSCANTSNTTTILKCSIKEPNVILPIGIDVNGIIINKKKGYKFKKKIIRPAIECLGTSRFANVTD